MKTQVLLVEKYSEFQDVWHGALSHAGGPSEHGAVSDCPPSTNASKVSPGNQTGLSQKLWAKAMQFIQEFSSVMKLLKLSFVFLLYAYPEGLARQIRGCRAIRVNNWEVGQGFQKEEDASFWLGMRRKRD